MLEILQPVVRPKYRRCLDLCSQRTHIFSAMIYIQLTEEHDAVGFLALVKSGVPVSCFPHNSYGVKQEHLRLLKRMKIPFKRLKIDDARFLSPQLG